MNIRSGTYGRPWLLVPVLLLGLLASVCDAQEHERFRGGGWDGYDWGARRSVLWNINSTPLIVSNADGATAILGRSASLNGAVESADAQGATVSLHWGTNDGGSDEAQWDNRHDFGVCSSGQNLTASVTGLTVNTAYYYRFSAVSVSEGIKVWAASSSPFSTLGDIVLTPTVGPVSRASATFTGTLLEGVNVHVYCLWGPDTNRWLGTNDLGTLSAPALLVTPVSGLEPGTEYAYRFYGVNPLTNGWSAVAIVRTPADRPKWLGGGYDGYAVTTTKDRIRAPMTGVILLVR